MLGFVLEVLADPGLQRLQRIHAEILGELVVELRQRRAVSAP